MTDFFKGPKRMISWLVALVFMIMSVWSHAAIDRSYASLSKKHRYIEDGSVTGGESGNATYSLLDVRRFFSAKDKIERIFLDLGDERGQPLINKVSYFHASIEKKNPRVVIDLSQMTSSGVNAEKIAKVFKSSPYVRQAKINFDPVDNSITIQLILKKNMQMEVFKLPGREKASRVVVDLKAKS